MVHFVFKKKKDFPKNSQFFITVTCVWFEEALVIFTVYKQIWLRTYWYIHTLFVGLVLCHCHCDTALNKSHPNFRHMGLIHVVTVKKQTHTHTKNTPKHPVPMTSTGDRVPFEHMIYISRRNMDSCILILRQTTRGSSSSFACCARCVYSVLQTSFLLQTHLMLLWCIKTVNIAEPWHHPGLLRAATCGLLCWTAACAARTAVPEDW